MTGARSRDSGNPEAIYLMLILTNSRKWLGYKSWNMSGRISSDLGTS